VAEPYVRPCTAGACARLGRLDALRGKVKFALTWQELRGKDDERSPSIRTS